MSGRRVTIVTIIYLVLASLLQSLLSHLIYTPYRIPDLLLMLPVLGGIWFGRHYGFRVGLAAGFFRDFLAGRLLGPGMLIGMYIGLAASLLNHADRRFRFLFSAVAVPAATVFHTAVMTVLTVLWPMSQSIPHDPQAIWSRALSQLPMRLLVNAAAGAFVLALFFLLPLKKRKKQSDLSYGKAGGVEHDVFDLT